MLPNRIPVEPRLAVAAAIAAGFVTALYAFTKTAINAESGHFEITREALSVVFIASVAAAIGAVSIIARYRTLTAMLSAISTGLLAFGLVAGSSIGVISAVLGVIALCAMVMNARSLDWSSARGSVSSGFLLGLGLIVLFAAFAQSPIV
jgi:hypothetical protein